MIRTKARKALTHFGPSLRAKSHNFDQETILVMSPMSLVSSFFLHFSRRRDLSVLTIWSLICLGDGLLSSSDSESELDNRSKCVKLVLKCSSSSRHSRMRQTDSMSSERANSVCVLRVSEEESVIRRRKHSFLVKQRTYRERSSEFSMNCHRGASSHIHTEGLA